MRKVTQSRGALGAAIIALGMAACGDDAKEENPPTGQTPGNIAQVAESAGFTELLKAANAAGIAPALTGSDMLTVFAPTDAAFAALGAAAPSDPKLLANVLLAHVAAGKLDSSQVTSTSNLVSLAKTPLNVDAQANPITINGFNLSSTLDVPASNGIIHVLDQVIVPPTILEAAKANSELSTLVTAVEAASQQTQTAIQSPAAFTLFAPVNSAFAKIPAADLQALLANQSDLDGVLGYHVLIGQVLSSDLTDGQEVSAVTGEKFTVNLGGAKPTLTDVAGNTITIVETDIRLLNGTVHLIDTVMMPKAPVVTPGTIVEVATQAGTFNSLLGAATTAGLAETLGSAGPFTVFAPTDAAFTALGVDLSAVRPEVIGNILLHHVLAGNVPSSEVLGQTNLSTLANTSLAVAASENPVTVGGAKLSTSIDVAASNGTIHILDDVIVPPTILEVAQATSDLSILVSAVGAASDTVKTALAPAVLTGAGPITVFAPTNAAFMAAGIDLNAIDQTTLDGVLAHHAVASQALSTDLSDGQQVPTLNGNITIEVGQGGAVTVIDGQGNRANVVATLKDIRTLTGVVHVIDKVLLP